MDGFTFVAVFSAGAISFLSPCVLPLLPTYIALLAGSSPHETAAGGGVTRHLFINVLCFLAGFTLVFVAMGATASYLGQFFFENRDVLRKVGAVFMAVMGVQLAGVIPIGKLYREYRPFMDYTLRGPLGSMALGAAFTIGWTPCIGPILAAVLAYSAMADTVGRGAWLLFVYAMGFSLPFLFVAFIFNRFIFHVRIVYKWLPYIQKIAGVALIITAAAIYFDLLTLLLGRILTAS